MKDKTFTLRILAAFALVIACSFSLQAQNTGTGTGWETLQPGELMILNENFTSFTHFHSQQHADDSNARNNVDGDGNITWGLKEDTVQVSVEGSTKRKVEYQFYQCAFAPAWTTAYEFKDSLNNGEGESTRGVTRGFVEISREFASHNTVNGHFLIDLRQIEYIEAIQYSHSSSGGNRRGFILEYSMNDGETWDSLRFQPGNAWSSSFTQDVWTMERTYNEFNCQPSAYGMTWEDGLYADNLMLRFGIASNQALRIHDFKVYGTPGEDNGNSVNQISNKLRITQKDNTLHISRNAHVQIFSISGQLVQSVNNTHLVNLTNLSQGIYIVKANANGAHATEKVMIR